MRAALTRFDSAISSEIPRSSIHAARDGDHLALATAQVHALAAQQLAPA
jgi:hypothetical protein